MVIDFALCLLAVCAFAVLAAFAARRLIFLFTLLHPVEQIANLLYIPDVLLLIPARDESASLPALFTTLDKLDYPHDKLRVVLIDDGSTDATGGLMTTAAARRPNWHTLSLPVSVGKAQALNLALAGHDYGDLVYIFDADHCPQPDCLRKAVSAFADPHVAGVSGRTIASNALASAAAFYSAVEAMVHQLITMRGKDVLRLGPALLGSNNGYRRSALAEAGGFRPGAFLEDSDLTLSLHRAGYTTRFIPDAVSFHQAPTEIRGYVRQHLRWGRGFNDVARTHLKLLITNYSLSLPMRIELAIFSVGYLDRLALLAAIVFAIFGIARPLMLWGIGLSLGLPLVQILAAFIFDRARLGMWLRLPFVPLFFVLDAVTAVGAMAATLLNLPRIWSKTERA